MHPHLQLRPVSQPGRPAAAVVAIGLDLLLMDSALQHIEQARRRMARRDSSEKQPLLAAAVQIVGELRSSLDIHEGGPIAANLDDLCEYMGRQLVAADRQNRIETLDEVSDLLREVRTAWILMPPEARRPSCMTERIR